MQQLERIGKHVNEHGARLVFLRLVVGIQPDFTNLNLPIAKHVPDKIVQLLNGNAQFEAV